MIRTFKALGHHHMVADEMRKNLDLQASTGSNSTPAKWDTNVIQEGHAPITPPH